MLGFAMALRNRSIRFRESTITTLSGLRSGHLANHLTKRRRDHSTLGSFGLVGNNNDIKILVLQVKIRDELILDNIRQGLDIDEIQPRLVLPRRCGH